ncbi:F-box/LRR-repeat protein 4-like [Rhododendron vialii]|uniref:F-box/LRR-repeat protein 4-like n=1 Tax=Rhododendron vialii TaxID=182163 RepID=UPI00265F2078|nr:F-box/LRR-repeat protein 4-like [Rhododendron vialii]
MDGGVCDELLEEVLRRLPSSSSAADVSLVSKRWLRLYLSSRTTLSLRLSPDNWTPHSLSSFLSHFPNLSYLSVTINGRDRVSSFPDHILLSFASSRPKPTVASSCPKPTRLCLHPEPVSHFPLLSLSTSFPHLTSLDIALYRPFNFHWLLFFHSLKNLNVSFLYGFEPVDTACEGNYDGELKLETLNVFRIRRGDHGLNWLWKSCKTLKKLQLKCCGGIGDDTSGSSFVNCLKDLQEVELIHCGPTIRDEILLKLVDNCASLSSLLVHDRYAGTIGLRQFITHSCCNLRKLDLCTLHDLLTETCLLAVGEKFRGLLSLRLHGFSSITDEGLKTMMLAMSNELEELALVNCNSGPGLLTTLGQKFQNLRKLD